MENLWSDIRRVSQLSGHFTLRSGIESNTYFDKYQFECRPELLRAVAEKMRLLIPADTEILGGLELGGVPLAVTIALASGHPCIFVRKAAKSYGTCKLAEGPPVADRHVCLIEDVITTGGQVAESARELRALGATVNHVVCAIWRGDPNKNPLAQHGITVHSVFQPGVGT
jgi:orotate phosphoribosyltransferase